MRVKDIEHREMLMVYIERFLFKMVGIKVGKIREISPS